MTAALVVALALAALPLTALAAGRGDESRGNRSTIVVGFLHQLRPPRPAASPLDPPAPGEGLDGARLAIADGAVTARFAGPGLALAERVIDGPAAIAPALDGLAAAGARFIVADLDAPLIAAAVALPGADRFLFLNSRAPDDALRAEHCAPNLLHTIPSRAMLADALAQYLVWKRWRRWFLVVGSAPGDTLYAAALRRAAGRFGAEIVAERGWTFRAGSGRADTGHVTLQAEIPAFTQGPDHDVLVVADETDAFGEYLIGRTARPRPVVGTHGLIAAGWSPVAEQWGSTQLQHRFVRLAGRRMTAVDYAAWAAVRAVAEAALRAPAGDAAAIAAYLRGPDFLLSGFKGRGQSFRAHDGQMRQPILIAGPRLLVSVSPQPGFLHRDGELDSLGFDREESRCGR